MKAKTTFALLLLLVGISVVAQAQTYPRATLAARAIGTPRSNWEYYLGVNAVDFSWDYNAMLIWTNWKDGTPLVLFVYDGASSSNAYSAYVATVYALEAARWDGSTAAYLQATIASNRCTSDMGVCYVDLNPATGCYYYLFSYTSESFFADHISVTARNPEGTYWGLNVGSNRVVEVVAYNNGGLRFDFYGTNQGGINGYYSLTSWYEPPTSVFDEFVAVLGAVLSEGHKSVLAKARAPYQNYPGVLRATEPMTFY